MLVQAIVTVDSSRNDTEYLTWKEQCFDSLRDNNVDICQTEFILDNLLLARNNAINKSTAEYVFVIDPDDYIGPGYVGAMLSQELNDKEILYPYEMRVVSEKIIVPSRFNNVKPTRTEILKPQGLAHHPFGRRETLQYLYSLCAGFRIDSVLFKKRALEQRYNYTLRSKAIYFWRHHPDQFSKTVKY